MTTSWNHYNKEQAHFWVIGGGLLQLPLIAEVRAAGYKTIVSDLNPDCVCRSEADRFFELDIFDIPGHIRAVDHLLNAGHRLVAVLAAGIDAPETMAALARHLGLSAVEPDIARTVHNKDLFRQAMMDLGHPVPRFKVLDSNTSPELPSVIDEIGYPLIVKNTNSSGSRGTKIFHAPDMAGISETIEAAIAVSRSNLALIEECWEGSEHTVETLFDVNGDFHPCFITDRIFDRRAGYAMETGLRHPSRLPGETQKEMYRIAEHVARDLGVRIGAAKYDMMVTAEGIRIIEATVRLSGGFDCQYLVPAATGKNVLRAAIDTALGRPFGKELLTDTKHRVGLTASIWPAPGKLVSVSGLEAARRVPGFEHIFMRYDIGDIVAPYTDCTKRVCFIIVTGENEKAAQESLEKVISLVDIQTEGIN